MRSLYRVIKIITIVSLVFCTFIISAGAPSALNSNPPYASYFDSADLSDYSDAEIERILFKSTPIIGGYWENPVPGIRICSDSGVTEGRLRRAVTYWEKLGYKFGPITSEEGTFACATGGKSGEITVMLFMQEVMSEDHLAVTRTYKHIATKEILKAEIFINQYAAEKPMVLEHEIGHALGWLHFNSRGHIMHANYPLCGHTSSGLDSRSYDTQKDQIISDLDPVDNLR